MIHLSIDVCIIIVWFSLLFAALPCPTMSAFVSIITLRSTRTRCGTLTFFMSKNDDELVSKEFTINDEETRMLVNKLKKEKEELLERLKEQEEDFNKLITEKELLIAANELVIERNQGRIDDKLKLIANLEVDILAAESKLSVRGLFEFFGEILKKEIVKYIETSIFRKGNPSLLPTTQALRDVAKLAYDKNSLASKEPNIVLLRECYEKCVDVSLHNGDECVQFFQNLWGELSKSIHQVSWSGPEVGNTLKDVPNGAVYTCFLGELFQRKFDKTLVDIPTFQRGM